MLDIDYCKGENCSMCTICQRYCDYIHRLNHKQDVRYARIGNNTANCEQFKPKMFTGD